MSLSSCIECWDTPCTCGYGYRDYTENARINLASKVLGIDAEALRGALVNAKIKVSYPGKDYKQVTTKESPNVD